MLWRQSVPVTNQAKHFTACTQKSYHKNATVSIWSTFAAAHWCRSSSGISTCVLISFIYEALARFPLLRSLGYCYCEGATLQLMASWCTLAAAGHNRNLFMLPHVGSKAALVCFCSSYMYGWSSHSMVDKCYWLHQIRRVMMSLEVS